MNTTDSTLIYCNFIAINYNVFQCDRCGLIISSEDEDAPIMICHHLDLKSVKEPSLSEKAIGFTQAVIDHASNGLSLCDDIEIAQRYTICNGCEFFQHNKCKVCGCPILSRKSLFGKLSWKSSKCPLNKW